MNIILLVVGSHVRNTAIVSFAVMSAKDIGENGSIKSEGKHFNNFALRFS